MSNTYADFLVDIYKINTLEELREEVCRLKRENFGLKTTIKNLEEKLGKRNDGFIGEVYDRDGRKKLYR